MLLTRVSSLICQDISEVVTDKRVFALVGSNRKPTVASQVSYTQVSYTTRKKKQDARPPKRQLYVLDPRTKTIRQVSSQRDGLVTSPTFAPDGSIAWLHRPGPSEYNNLWRSNVESNNAHEVPLDWHLHPESVLVGAASCSMG